MKTKVCTKCGKVKPINRFSKAKTCVDGFRNDCKNCATTPSKKFLESKRLFLLGMKQCIKCKHIKPLSDFHKSIHGVNGITGYCGKCLCQLSKQYKDKNPEKIELYIEKNKKRDKEYKKEYNKNNKLRRNKTRQKKYNTDINYKLLTNLRTRLTLALQGKLKSKRTLELLGCSVEKLKQHLQSKFTKGMNWDNHGYGEHKWHIDHIRPCASFDLSKPEEQCKCFNYSNLQPLWQNNNFKKGSKYVS